MLKHLTVRINILLVLFLASCNSKQITSEEKKQKPNVVLFSVDDLNDWIGCLKGHPQAITPNFDRLAKRGTLFTNAHCQSPVCLPSRSSMMASKYPHETGLYFLSPSLFEVPNLKESQLMPQAFKNNGYDVYAGGKLFHHNDNEKVFEPIGEYFNSGGFGPLPEKKISPFPGHKLWDWGAFPLADSLMPDYKMHDWGINKLQNMNPEKPFFLAFGFFRPHVPLYVPQKWFDKYPLEDIQLPEILENDLDDLSDYAVSLTRDKHVAPTHEWVKENKEWKKLVQSYLASITFVDHYIGKVLDAIESSPFADNTYVILYSDHGFNMGEKERWAKRALWENSTRVPIMISGPGIKQQTVNQPAQLLDIYPTLSELCNLDSISDLSGESLAPLLEGTAKDWDHVAITEYGPGNVSVRNENLRYISYADGSEELYDLTQDKHEWNNIISDVSYSEQLKRLRTKVPSSFHPLLGEKSTGHNAFEFASKYISN